MASERIGSNARRGGLAPLDVILWMVVLAAALCVGWYISAAIVGRRAPAPERESAAEPPARPDVRSTVPILPIAPPAKTTPRADETNRPDPDIPPGEIAS